MKKCLIIRLDGLGDTVLTLPFIDSIRSVWPECNITFLASPLGAEVFTDDSRIDQIWMLDMATSTFQERVAFGFRVRRECFDAVFCLNEKFWPAIWALMSGASIRAGFDPGWSQFPKAVLRRLTLTHRVSLPNKPHEASIHEIDRYLQLLAPPGLNTHALPLRMCVPDSKKLTATNLLKAMFASNSHNVVCIHLSQKWTLEEWSETDLMPLLQTLLQETDHFFVLTAGPAEQDLGSHIESMLSSDRIRQAPRLELLTWAALLAQCRAIVTMDTGAVHVAAAVGCPVIDIFPTRNFIHASSRWAPWKVRHRSLERPLAGGADVRNRFFVEVAESLKQVLAQEDPK